MPTPSVPFTPANLREAVRLYMRDLREFNALIDAEETPDSIIDLCIQLALNDFNITPPPITFSLENFPAPYLLFMGTVIQVLRSAGLLQSRNELNYSDGGITVATSDKTASYMRWIELFTREYEQKKRDFKIARNALGAYGGVHSEYTFVNFAGGFTGFLQFDTFDLLRSGFIRPGVEGF